MNFRTKFLLQCLLAYMMSCCYIGSMTCEVINICTFGSVMSHVALVFANLCPIYENKENNLVKFSLQLLSCSFH